MTDAAHMEKFKEYYKTLDQMIAQSSKEDLAECARLLALKAKYGELPLEEHQDMLQTDDIDQELAKLLASGMLEMTMALAQVTGRLEQYEKLKTLGRRFISGPDSYPNLKRAWELTGRIEGGEDGQDYRYAKRSIRSVRRRRAGG